MDDGYKTCAFCGKRIDLFRHVTNPSFWGYRWGQTYFCSWKCLRAKEKKMEGNGGPADMARKLTLEQEDIRGLVEALPIIVGMFKA